MLQPTRGHNGSQGAAGRMQKKKRIARHSAHQRARHASQRPTCLSVEPDIHLNMWRTRASPAHMLPADFSLRGQASEGDQRGWIPAGARGTGTDVRAARGIPPRTPARRQVSPRRAPHPHCWPPRTPAPALKPLLEAPLCLYVGLLSTSGLGRKRWLPCAQDHHTERGSYL